MALQILVQFETALRTVLPESGDCLQVDIEVDVVVLRTEHVGVADEVGNAGVSGFRDVVRRGFVSFLPVATVRRLTNHVPAGVLVQETAVEDGGGGSEGQHDGREDGQLVVDVSARVDVSGRESLLDTPHAHPETHVVHPVSLLCRVFVLEHS